MDNQDIETGKLDDLKDNIAQDMASLEDLYAEGPQKTEAAPREPQRLAKAEATQPDDVSRQTPPPKPKAKASDDEDGDEPDDVQGLKAALKATRQKARERAERLKEYEEKLTAEQRRAAEADHVARQLYARQQQTQQPQQQEMPPPPDPLVDPQGALEYRDRIWADVIRQRDEVLRQQSEDLQQQIYMSRVIPSQRMMRQQFQDYDDMEKAFAEAANQDPRLWQEIRRQEFPAEYAYRVGKQIKQAQEIQSSGGWEQWLDTKVNEKFAALQQSHQAQPAPQAQSYQAPSAPKAPPPQSLARMPSVTPRNQAKSYNGPTPISDLYK